MAVNATDLKKGYGFTDEMQSAEISENNYPEFRTSFLDKFSIDTNISTQEAVSVSLAAFFLGLGLFRKWQNYINGSSYKPAQSNTANTLNNGPFGKFYKEEKSELGVYFSVYTSLRESSTENPQPLLLKHIGRFILFADTNTNHTIFSELPQFLVQQGWDVKIVVMPEYENLGNTKEMIGGLGTVQELSRRWISMARVATNYLVRTAPNGPVILSGTGLGATMSLIGYAHLPETLQRKVIEGGLIPISPFLGAREIEKKNFLMQKITRFFFWPIMTILDGFLRGKLALAKELPEIDPGIMSYVDSFKNLQKNKKKYTWQFWSEKMAALHVAEQAAKIFLPQIAAHKVKPPVLLACSIQDQISAKASVTMIETTFPHSKKYQHHPYKNESGDKITTSRDRIIFFDKVLKMGLSRIRQANTHLIKKF